MEGGILAKVNQNLEDRIAEIYKNLKPFLEAGIGADIKCPIRIVEGHGRAAGVYYLATKEDKIWVGRADVCGRTDFFQALEDINDQELVESALAHLPEFLESVVGAIVFPLAKLQGNLDLTLAAQKVIGKPTAAQEDGHKELIAELNAAGFNAMAYI